MTDFNWVKDRGRREEVLSEYVALRGAMQEYIRNVYKLVGMDDLKDAAAKLGIALEDKTFMFRSEAEMAILFDYCVFVERAGGKCSAMSEWIESKKGGAIEDAMEQKMLDSYAGYRYAWLVPVASKAGFGLRCHDMMTNEDIFLIDRQLSKSASSRRMGLLTGMLPCGDCWMTTGAALPIGASAMNVAFKLVLQQSGLGEPHALTTEEQVRFAACSISALMLTGVSESVRYE